MLIYSTVSPALVLFAIIVAIIVATKAIRVLIIYDFLNPFLFATLNSVGIPFKSVALPNENSEMYNQIRLYLRKTYVDIDQLQQYMLTNMDDCFSKIIIPTIQIGENVILDRWAVSTIIYNMINNGKLITDNYLTSDGCIDMERIVRKSSCFVWPNKIFYLNTPKKVLIDNAIKRSKLSAVEIFDKEEKVVALYNGYQDFYKAITNEKLKFEGYPIYEFKTSINKDRHMLIEPNPVYYANPFDTGLYISMEDKIFDEIAKDVGVI